MRSDADAKTRRVFASASLRIKSESRLVVQSPMNSLFNNKEDDMAYLPADARYASMTYNRCGRSGLKLPSISLGLWHNFGGVDQFENGRAMLRRAFDLEITHFDLANNYGPPPGSAETTV